MPRARKATPSAGAPQSGAQRADIQRDLNEELVLSSLRAHEAVEAAEGREQALEVTAELRERLLGIIGHDLRTPLSAMMMGADLLVANGRLNEDDRRVVGRILRSAHRMNRMIGQILDFTRSRLGGGMRLEFRPGSNLGEVCRSVGEELLISHPGSVEWCVEGDLTGSWDPDRLTQAISNIASNGIEHAQAGTRVVLHAHAEGDQVVVEIANEGAPIPPALLPFIFDPFRRAKNQKTSKAGNLGLGLYIANEITRAHAGKLEVACASGKTTFTLRVPRIPPPNPSTAAPITT